jgi:RNA polymerase sigma-70 factor (ECF subfamily)
MPQETLMAAWRGLDGFEDMSFPEPSEIAVASWVEPYPDELLGDLADRAQGPGTRYAARESISLAFVTALQHLPPRRRAALVLCDVLGFGAAEAAEMLDSSAEAVNAALAAARAVIAAQLPPGSRDRSPLPGSASECAVAGRFADALERGDADGIAALLTDDAWLTAPPVPFGYRGRAAAEFLSAAPCRDGTCRDGTRRFRLIATRANGQPAFGCYLSEPAAPIARVHSLIVLTLAGDRVSGITRFTDGSVLRLFGLPSTLPG